MASKWVVVVDDVDGVIGPFESKREAERYIELFPCGDFAFAVSLVEPEPMPETDSPGQQCLFPEMRDNDGA